MLFNAFKLINFQAWWAMIFNVMNSVEWR